MKELLERFMSWLPRKPVERIDCGHRIPSWRWYDCSGQSIGFCMSCERVCVIQMVRRPRRRLALSVEMSDE